MCILSPITLDVCGMRDYDRDMKYTVQVEPPAAHKYYFLAFRTTPIPLTFLLPE